MKNLFEFIAAHAKRRKAFEQSEEFSFFIENRHVLTRLPKFINLYDYSNNPFQVMRANVVLHSCINKSKIEEAVHSLVNSSDYEREAFIKAISELPSYQIENDKIYIPFFTRSLNEVYINEPEKLLSKPYEGLIDNFDDTIIDPFDTYGNELYNSGFSNLIKVCSSDNEIAYFHHATNTIYFVNEQGRLDASIVLFDRRLYHPNYENILERIKPVIDAYFAFDREGMIDALHDNGFISGHLLHLIRFHDWTKL